MYKLHNQTELMEQFYPGQEIVWNPPEKPLLIQANASALKAPELLFTNLGEVSDPARFPHRRSPP